MYALVWSILFHFISSAYRRLAGFGKCYIFQLNFYLECAWEKDTLFNLFYHVIISKFHFHLLITTIDQTNKFDRKMCILLRAILIETNDTIYLLSTSIIKQLYNHIRVLIVERIKKLVRMIIIVILTKRFHCIQFNNVTFNVTNDRTFLIDLMLMIDLIDFKC